MAWGVVALVTNYVTAEVPGWAKIPWLVWSVLAILVVVAVGLGLWNRHLDAGAGSAAGPARLAPVDRVVAAAAAGSLAAPRLRTALRGRDAELAALRRLLDRPRERFAVVCGTGGIGKTTLATALAEHAKDKGQAVFWVTWRGRAQFGEDMLRVAVACGLPEETMEAARTGRVPLADVVWGQLSERGKWLLVLDNLDDPENLGPQGSGPLADYRGWVRPGGGGLLLVTSRDTRAHTWGPDADLTRLEPLNEQPGADLLLDLAPSAGDRPDAELLAARLGGLPLALQAAGRYLAAPGSRYRTFATYTTALDIELGSLLAAPHPESSDPDVARTVVRHTWELSLDQLAHDGNDLASPVLHLLALMAPAPVPLAFLTPELVHEATGGPADPVRIEAAINGLHAYGLLQTPTTDPTGTTPAQINLHPLIREITAHTRTSESPNPTPWYDALTHQLARSVQAAEAAGTAGWPVAVLLVPHALAFAARRDGGDTVIQTVCQLADLQRAAGQATNALALTEIGLEQIESRFGVDHPVSLTSRNNLGVALFDLGRHQEAADLHTTTLATRERVLHSDDPDILQSRSNLAVALHALGRYQEAADLYTSTLAARERVLGPDHPDTLTSSNNVAGSLHSLRRHQEAADLHTATLATRERVLGPDHPDTLTSSSNLAYALNALGRHQEAADLNASTLAARERTLGSNHPDTLTSGNNLACTLNALGRHQEAADLHTATLATLQRVAGPHHPRTLSSRNDLAEALLGLGRHQMAIDLHTATFVARERVLGPDHPDTLTSRNNLAAAQQCLQAGTQRGRRWRVRRVRP
ncbi:tetratricopeptide repeat protein [Streptomyces flavotricini]|uniref:Tetratricopeptide repeat protein n=1 Tax=Streptomyces flavotricini TaxID=66888 RepID=A0ABS8DWS2_9ACTN|nr:FxSxx-COOH system tetratricopeptide repeat protein [Streptomyces flavotricini]MCC0093245.1 tetratricopeptide repeat protein [Streptomyces flavotricini]